MNTHTNTHTNTKTHTNTTGMNTLKSTEPTIRNMKISLINIQGLTQVKAVEIEQLFEEHDILCLTETQQKFEKVNFSRDVGYITSMRDMQDKKGGGLMILYKKKHYGTTKN